MVLVILDATALTCWLRCREEFRLTYLMNRASAFVAVHREAGISIHRGVEALWLGLDFSAALMVTMEHFQAVPAGRIHPNDARKWEELKAMAPTMLATYADAVETTPLPSLELTPPPGPAICCLEHEWTLKQPFGVPELTLVGRIDRFDGKTLFDVKTASEIDGYDEMMKKVGWERSYRAAMCKDLALGLYDHFLRQIGLAPSMVALEVILKPSERYGKKCRVVRLELPEVLAYRERFDMLLEHTCREVIHYVKSYHAMSPWPMNVSACSGKYGNCHFMALCGLGSNPRTEKLYMPKVEHLSIQGKRIEL